MNKWFKLMIATAMVIALVLSAVPALAQSPEWESEPISTPAGVVSESVVLNANQEIALARLIEPTKDVTITVMFEGSIGFNVENASKAVIGSSVWVDKTDKVPAHYGMGVYWLNTNDWLHVTGASSVKVSFTSNPAAKYTIAIRERAKPAVTATPKVKMDGTWVPVEFAKENESAKQSFTLYKGDTLEFRDPIAGSVKISMASLQMFNVIDGPIPTPASEKKSGGYVYEAERKSGIMTTLAVDAYPGQGIKVTFQSDKAQTIMVKHVSKTAAGAASTSYSGTTVTAADTGGNEAPSGNAGGRGWFLWGKASSFPCPVICCCPKSS